MALEAHYLVTNKDIDSSTLEVDVEAIQDAIKVVSLLRPVRISQIFWYLVGVLARAFQEPGAILNQVRLLHCRHILLWLEPSGI